MPKSFLIRQTRGTSFPVRPIESVDCNVKEPSEAPNKRKYKGNHALVDDDYIGDTDDPLSPQLNNTPVDDHGSSGIPSREPFREYETSYKHETSRDNDRSTHRSKHSYVTSPVTYPVPHTLAAAQSGVRRASLGYRLNDGYFSRCLQATCQRQGNRTSVGFEKQNHCTFCSKGFNDKFDLKRHIRTHTGVRPFKCDRCFRAFTQRCSLEVHQRKVHNIKLNFAFKQRRGKIYVCEHCGHSTDDINDHYSHSVSVHRCPGPSDDITAGQCSGPVIASHFPLVNPVLKQASICSGSTDRPMSFALKYDETAGRDGSTEM